MIIPGFVVSALTFPGVVIHELAHQLFCRITKTPVFEVCYFQFNNPCGYVIHENPSKLSSQVLIAIGPFLFNTIIGAIIAMPAAIGSLDFSDGSLLDSFLIWLGISIAIHSFPSTGDAKSIVATLKKSKGNFIAKLLIYPIVGIIYLGAIGSVLWLDVIYGVSVVELVPKLLIHLLA